MASRLIYSREEILSEHVYARPHEEAGYRLHGGFLIDGTYASPRTLVRKRAVAAWTEALKARREPLIDVSSGILLEEIFPNLAQSRLLLKLGLDRTFWRSLTNVGLMEARAGTLCKVIAPDFQPLIEEDISGTVAGHLNKGLLWAHGVDEAGDPNAPHGPGAHNAAWFAVRDMVFAKGLHVAPVVPHDLIGRGRVPTHEMPQIPLDCEVFLKFLMGVLVVEVRAYVFFDLARSLFRDPELFPDRRDQAERAADLVDRIRQDEQIHVDYLQTLISELRQLTFKTREGPTSGASIIDPVWDRIRGVNRPQRREAVSETILSEMLERMELGKARTLVDQFEALGPG